MNPDRKYGRCSVAQEVDFDKPQQPKTNDDFCSTCLDGEGELIGCHGLCKRSFHRSCVKVSSDSGEGSWYCSDCINRKQACLVCGTYGTDGDDVERCSRLCGKFYHRECMAKEIKEHKFMSEINYCRRHRCSTCHESGSGRAMLKCALCPSAYHVTVACRPKVNYHITKKTVICMKHKEPFETPMHITLKKLEAKDKRVLAMHGTQTKKRSQSMGNLEKRIVKVQRNKYNQLVEPLIISKTLKITNLGKILSGRHYHNSRYIFPIGFSSEREYQSIKDEKRAVYINDIIDGGDKPVFRVTCKDDPSRVYTSDSPSGVWSNVLKDAHKLSGKPLPVVKGGRAVAVSGPTQFGLAYSIVQRLVEELPGAEECIHYRSYYDRNS